ncbi:MAG: dihydrolipoamide acetyltransferase component of pyruvate dehydrogenase complex [Microbacteriaceae bacterium]|nr:dihydrolipoamide acetyltransferase component of pyruvate dehydrogenase complex [Microbacteriaceae bacterium]
MSTRDFTLPDLGEGLTESELIEWHVAVGDLVTLNQPIAEVETAKAIVQLPSPFAGRVTRLHAEPGTTVAVGAPLMTFEVESDVPAVRAESEPIVAAVERNSVLVGYGPPIETGNRPRRKTRRLPERAPVSGTVPDPEAESVPVSGTVPDPGAESVPVRPPAEAAPERPRSTPPVRKLAQDLGVELRELVGSGEDGSITRDDVRAAASAIAAPQAAARQLGGADRSAGRRETRVPIRGVRKHTAAAMVSSAFTAPHVTVFLTVDVTPTVELLERLRSARAFAGQKLTMLGLVAKALCIAVAHNPTVNSRWDEPAGEIVQFGYVNLGIAVATPRGLMVPIIPDADALSLGELSAAIGSLAETARAGQTPPERLSGGTISISNVGVFGVDAGTPILNPGEAAILAMGAVRRLPWEFGGEIALREVMTLSLSFDHRIVDGEQGSRFLSDIGMILADPGMALTMV